MWSAFNYPQVARETWRGVVEEGSASRKMLLRLRPIVMHCGMDNRKALAAGGTEDVEWIEQELAGCQFADARHGKRLQAVLGQCSERIGGSIPWPAKTGQILKLLTGCFQINV